MVEIPQWFTSEVARRLRKVTSVPGSVQHYACCPAHDDHGKSLAIRPGDYMQLVYFCHNQPGCSQETIRDALLNLGVPGEYLGAYGTPEYQARRSARSSSDEWRKIERLRNEMADLKNGVRSLLVTDLSLAMLKVRLLAVVDDADIPVGRKEYVAFAVRAGVSQPRAYEAWKVDPLTLPARSETQCVTRDHVVLTQSDEIRQAAQVKEPAAIIEPRKLLSNREEINSRTDNSRTEKTGDAAA